MRSFLFLFAVVSMAHAQSPAPKTAAPAKARPAATRPAAAKPKPKAAAAEAASSAQSKSAPLATDDEKTVYSLGLSIYRTLTQFDLSPEEVALVQRAISDAAAGKPAVDFAEWAPKLRPLAAARATRITERQKAASKAYLEKAAAEPGAERTASGLIYREVTPGTGASPAATDKVKVNYRGTLVDGAEFDSSYKRNEPAEFPLNGVIPCWTEGVQKMKAGGRSVLVCPAELAYGDRARPSIPGGSALIFEIELLEIVGASPAPAPAR